MYGGTMRSPPTVLGKMVAPASALDANKGPAPDVYDLN